MPRHTSASMSSKSSKSSCDTTFSHSSHHTYKTDITSYSDNRPSPKRCDTAPFSKQQSAQAPNNRQEQDSRRLSTSSVDTYASTDESEDEEEYSGSKQSPKLRNHCFVPDAIPSTPPDFAQLFPSTRRLLIQHDDSTPDGNMNVRVDTEVITTSGKRRKMTLFHLRMKNLAERQFSLRRYARDSGREIVTSKRKYVKPLPAEFQCGKPCFQRSHTDPVNNLSRKSSREQDSGYETDDEDDDELEKSLRAFTLQSGIKATIPTNSIHLEFSNYAQVIVEPRRGSQGKEYGFEYWGEVYTWKRRLVRDEGEIIQTYDLVNANTGKKVAAMMPDALSRKETDFEASQGGWIPASSMRITQNGVTDDLGDVIVATGLISLTDDCIQRNLQQEKRSL